MGSTKDCPTGFQKPISQLSFCQLIGGARVWPRIIRFPKSRVFNAAGQKKGGEEAAKEGVQHYYLLGDHTEADQQQPQQRQQHQRKTTDTTKNTQHKTHAKLKTKKKNTKTTKSHGKSRKATKYPHPSFPRKSPVSHHQCGPARGRRECWRAYAGRGGERQTEMGVRIIRVSRGHQREVLPVCGHTLPPVPHNCIRMHTQGSWSSPVSSQRKVD